MNVSTTKSRVTLHQSERRAVDKARKISQQLWKAYEMTGPTVGYRQDGIQRAIGPVPAIGREAR